MASTSIPVLRGKAAEKFLEYDAKKPTKADLADLDDAEDFYLANCPSKKEQTDKKSK